MQIPFASVNVLLTFGFDQEDVSAFESRHKLFLPDSFELHERIVSIRKGLGLLNHPDELRRIIRLWPEILQYRSDRIKKRIEELEQYAGMNCGQATSVLRSHPSFIGLDVRRIEETAEVLSCIRFSLVICPQALMVSPEIIRGRYAILHRRGEANLVSPSVLFQPSHGPFTQKTRCDRNAVLKADPGHAAFLALRFAA
jgi:hypothetical protein